MNSQEQIFITTYTPEWLKEHVRVGTLVYNVHHSVLKPMYRVSEVSDQGLNYDYLSCATGVALFTHTDTWEDFARALANANDYQDWFLITR